MPRGDEKDFFESIDHVAVVTVLAGSIEVGEDEETVVGTEMGVDTGLSDRKKDKPTEVLPQMPENSSEFRLLCSDVAKIKAKQLVLESNMDTIIEFLMKSKRDHDLDSSGIDSNVLPPFFIPTLTTQKSDPPPSASSDTVLPPSPSRDSTVMEDIAPPEIQKTPPLQTKKRRAS